MSEVSGETEMESRVQAALPQDFSAMLDKVLSNPEILSSVASALSGSRGGEESSADTVRDTKAEDTAPAPPMDIDAMMQKLPDVMKMLSPMMSSPTQKNQGGPHSSDKRACLLLAIKPYLSPARCEAIDYMIKFSRLSEIIKSLN